MTKMTNRVLGLVLIIFLSIGLAACGSGGGGGGGGDGTSAPKVAVVGDDSGDEIASYLSSRGMIVDNFRGDLSSQYPDVSTDYVVWEDNRNGNLDIYAYKISEQREFQVTTDPGDQRWPRVYNDNIIVWSDNRNADTTGLDIYAYDLATNTEFPVAVADSAQYPFDASDTHIVWTDNRNGNGDIYAYRISDGTEIEVAVGAYKSSTPMVHGDYIVWNEDHGILGDNIYAYRISEKSTFQVTTGDRNYLYGIYGGYVVYISIYTDTNGILRQEVYARPLTASPIGATIDVTSGGAIYWNCGPMIHGDYIVWQRYSSGRCRGGVFAYQISTGVNFEIAPDSLSNSGSVSDLGMDSDYVVWKQFGVIHVYDLAQRERRERAEAPVIDPASYHGNMVLSSGIIVWNGDPFGYDDVYLTQDLGTTILNITESKVTVADVNPGDYDVVLFGNGIGDDETLMSVFDAADAAGVNMLGIGADYEDTLGGRLVNDNRFAMSTDDDSGISLMEIDVTAAGAGHAIFSGLDTALTLHLETSDDITNMSMDELVFYTYTALEGSPADWTVLATMGANMSLAGEPAIVEFTTPNETRVMLDGSANSGDDYDYWTEARWNLLYNEVMYLFE